MHPEPTIADTSLDMMSESDAASLRLFIAQRRVWSSHLPLRNDEGEPLLLVLPKRQELKPMTEDERLLALPALKQQLMANPHYAMVIEQEGDQYLLDWMTIWGTRYEPEPVPTGTDNITLI
ncbi:hypothetical protein [Propionivibrio sp.]|uniref:hypothetical protein n=1 Tax=Propionivibrio sp. TaxID=2212460 RepID=UPI003BF3AEEB